MYEVYCIKVAQREVESPVLFLHTDYGKKSTLAYNFFCLKGKGHHILIDTGIAHADLEPRGIFDAPAREDLLDQIGIRPGDVDTIILSHVHNDHFSGSEIYEKAVFYVQRREIEFWGGEVQGWDAVVNPSMLKGNRLVDILTLQKINIQGRLKFLDGDSEVYPGVGVLAWGGHTPGHQMITVQTARGPVLLGMDLFYMYRNLEQRIPVGILANLEEWLKGAGKIERMGLPQESIIPGHDPLIFTKFTKVSENIVKIA